MVFYSKNLEFQKKMDFAPREVVKSVMHKFKNNAIWSKIKEEEEQTVECGLPNNSNKEQELMQKRVSTILFIHTWN